MNKVSFFLARPNSTSRTLIRARMRFPGGEIKISTSFSVLPREWNPKRQRVIPSVMNALSMNEQLNQIEERLREIVLQLKREGIELSREEILGRFEPQKAAHVNVEDKTILDFWKTWLSETSTNKTSSTIARYESNRSNLEKYQECIGKPILFKDINADFVAGFSQYLLDAHDLQNSSVFNQFKAIKTFMGWANENGHTDNLFMSRITKKQFNVVDPVLIRLSEAELAALATVDLNQHPHLNNARNCFLLQSLIGVRYGDLLSIIKNPDAHIQGDTIRLLTEKNKKDVTIPLHRIAKSLLIGDNLVHNISNQKLNDYIKEVAKIANLDRRMTIHRYKGANRTSEIKCIHELISTHSAKRTFISRLLALGVPRDIIMSITGNSASTIDRYAKMEESEIQLSAVKAYDHILPDLDVASIKKDVLESAIAK